jgi:hypothetical protein
MTMDTRPREQLSCQQVGTALQVATKLSIFGSFYDFMVQTHYLNDGIAVIANEVTAFSLGCCGGVRTQKSDFS